MSSSSQLEAWNAQLQSVRARLAGAGVATPADLRSRSGVQFFDAIGTCDAVRRERPGTGASRGFAGWQSRFAGPSGRHCGLRRASAVARAARCRP